MITIIIYYRRFSLLRHSCDSSVSVPASGNGFTKWQRRCAPPTERSAHVFECAALCDVGKLKLTEVGKEHIHLLDSLSNEQITQIDTGFALLKQVFEQEVRG